MKTQRCKKCALFHIENVQLRGCSKWIANRFRAFTAARKPLKKDVFYLPPLAKHFLKTENSGFGFKVWLLQGLDLLESLANFVENTF